MKIRLFALISVLTISIGVPGLAKSGSVSAKRQIQAVYNRIGQAYLHRDLNGILDTRADNYTSFDPDGSVFQAGKEAERAHVLKLFAHSTRIDDKVIVLSVRLDGKNAIVVMKENYTRTQQDSIRGIGKLHETGTCRDYWISTPQGWRLSRSRVIQQTTTKTLNGQPFN